jgi:hypothetical protein
MEQVSNPPQPPVNSPVDFRLDGFRRTLREREQRAFDRVLDRARRRAVAALPTAGGALPEALFLCVLVEQELSIMRMEAAVEELCWSVLGRGSDPAAAHAR